MSQTSQNGRFRHLGFDPAYLPTFQDKLFIEGDQAPRRLINFFALTILATVIATYGLLSGSVATVIGAMIVAPLMGPIMATTAAVILGHGNRALRALLLVCAGILTVIALSFLLTIIVPDIVISFQDNPELASRISPGLFALFIALGSGAAGAFITARHELSDSIGGVAIAISLVPPLCVVGIALEQSNWTAALGAFLLFTTNFLAILLAGGIMFVLVGLAKFSTAQGDPQVRRRGLALIVLATLLVVVPLGVTSYKAVKRANDEALAARVTQEWLGDSGQTIAAVSVTGDIVLVSLEGNAPLPPIRDLVNALAAALKRAVIVTVRDIPSQTASSGAAP